MKIACNKCNLCKNQLPLVDNKISADIMFIGLSAKKVNDIELAIPLDTNTNSGKLLEEIEKNVPENTFYKTNLVKCLPLDNNNKLRYPTKKEINDCIPNLINEINIIKPRIIFLLGKIVFDSLKNVDLGTKYVYDIKHPSYIMAYKKNDKKNYINDIICKIKKSNN